MAVADLASVTMLLAFLSPYTYRALHLTRSPLLSLYSASVSRWLSQYDWSEIGPTTLTD